MSVVLNEILANLIVMQCVSGICAVILLWIVFGVLQHIESSDERCNRCDRRDEV